jgi:type I restriction enzyme S subunit
MTAKLKQLQNLVPNSDWASLPLFDRTGWRRMAFGDFAESIGVRAEPKDAQEEIYVGLEHLDPQCLHIRRWGKGSDVTGPKLRFRKRDIIFGRRRAYQRKLAVAQFDGICSAHAMVVRAKPEFVLPEFLPFFMMSDCFMNRAVEISVGSLSPTINWSTLKLETFSLPPLDQQRSIGEILQTADTALSAASEMFTSALNYQSAFLREAFDSLAEKDVEFPLVQDLIDGGVIDSPQDGNHGEQHPTSKDYLPDGVPFLMANDIKDGQLALNTCKRISEQLARSLRIGFARPGDILLSHKGTIGQTTIVPDIAGEFVMLTPQLTYYRVRDETRLRPRFLLAALRSEHFQRVFRLRAKQTTRDYIGIIAQRDLPIMVPNVYRQDEILLQLERIEQVVCESKANASKTSDLLDQLINRFC